MPWPGWPELHPYRVESPTTLRVSWNSTSTAALCENLPGIKRVASRDIEYTSNNYPEIYRLLAGATGPGRVGRRSSL